MRTRMMAAAERWGAFAPMVEPLLWLGLAVIPLLGGCQLHLHWGEKHYHGQATEPRSHEATQGAEPTIEANPRGEPGIEIVIPETRTKTEERSEK